MFLRCERKCWRIQIRSPKTSLHKKFEELFWNLCKRILHFKRSMKRYIGADHHPYFWTFLQNVILFLNFDTMQNSTHPHHPSYVDEGPTCAKLGHVSFQRCMCTILDPHPLQTEIWLPSEVPRLSASDENSGHAEFNNPGRPGCGRYRRVQVCTCHARYVQVRATVTDPPRSSS
jgi:hypothetical protein